MQSQTQAEKTLRIQCSPLRAVFTAESLKNVNLVAIETTNMMTTTASTTNITSGSNSEAISSFFSSNTCIKTNSSLTLNTSQQLPNDDEEMLV